MSIYYISIGNSDDKLSQREWSSFIEDVDIVVKNYHVHGRWFSEPSVPWQSGCWCVEAPEYAFSGLRPVLALLADRYQQNSIAIAVAATELVAPERPVP